MKKITVLTGGDERLNRFVQQLAFDAGYKWYSDNKTAQNLRAHGYVLREDGSMLYSTTGKDLTTSDGYYGSSSGYTQYDARTQLGSLMHALSTPGPVVIKNVTSSGRDGTISGNKQIVTVGCEAVSRDKVKEIYQAMFYEKA